MEKNAILDVYPILEDCYNLLQNDYQDKITLATLIATYFSNQDAFKHLPEEKLLAVNDLFAKLYDLDFPQAELKKAFGILFMKACSEDNKSSPVTPDMLGILISIIIDKTKPKPITIVDPVANNGLLLATIKCSVDCHTELVACCLDAKLSKWSRAFMRACQMDIEVITANPLLTTMMEADYIISELPTYHDNEYFPHEMTFKALEYLKEDGKIIWIVDEHFLNDYNKDDFKEKFFKQGSIEAIIKLPAWFFKQEKKDIYVISKDINNKNVLLLEYPEDDQKKQIKFLNELINKYSKRSEEEENE